MNDEEGAILSQHEFQFQIIRHVNMRSPQNVYKEELSICSKFMLKLNEEIKFSNAVICWSCLINANFKIVKGT